MTTSEGPWLEIAVEVAGIDAEIAADLLRQACPGGVAIETPSRLDRETDTYVADGDAPSVVKGYIRPGPDADRLQGSLRLALQTAPLQRPPIWHEPQELAEVDWRDAWKKFFGVIKAGKRLVIAPTWIEYAAREGDLVIRIDPGMAFGTGQHPTTAMCLTALEEVLPERVAAHRDAPPGEGGGAPSVLDLGCGSGILAIAAAKLGAARVLALDTDPAAVKATRENAEINGVTNVDARDGTLSEGEGFDVIVANISGLTLGRLAPVIAGSLAPGGRLIASGFLDEAVDGLRTALEGEGLTVERLIEDGVWRAIIALRFQNPSTIAKRDSAIRTSDRHA